jgi:hypothetical protein
MPSSASARRTRAPAQVTRWLAIAWVTVAAMITPASVSAVEVSGFVGVDGRLFLHGPATPGVVANSGSLVLQPEFFVESADGRHSAVLVPFLRLDSADGRRSHFDIREMLYHRYEADWELRLGLGKVFWGVTESRHLVDIINQDDGVENPDGEDKLGQPMLNLTLKRDFGVLDLFLLPGFRERTFPGQRGRLRSVPAVDADAALYESGAGRQRIDLAVRYSHSIGDYDIGLAHFHGTAREPLLIPDLDPSGQPRLRPRYDVIHRSALDLQATKGAMLWKLETVFQSGQGPSHIAWVAGGEYTLFGVAGGSADLGLLVEHLLDGRGGSAPGPFQNDLFLGARLALNDEASSELLAGVIEDLTGDGRVLSLEGSRRFSDRWTLDLEARVWAGIPARSSFASVRRDDYIQISLKRYF